MAFLHLHGGDLVVGSILFPLLWLFPITHWRFSGWVHHMSTMVALSWATNPTPESIPNLFLSLSVFCLEQRSPRSREQGRREIDIARTNAHATSNLVSDWILSCAFNQLTVFVCFLVDDFWFFFSWAFFSCFFLLSLLPRNGELHVAFA